MRLRLARLLTYPTVHVESVEPDRTHLRIGGLVCDGVCALRTKRALLELAGVRRVSVDFDAGTAEVEGQPHPASDYQRALDGVVAAQPLRRWLASLRRHHRRVPPPAPVR